MSEVAVVTLQELKRRSRWLNEYASDVYSQTGEDGVLANALEILPSSNQWCVEFGAWDGKHLSNTYSLVEKNGYHETCGPARTHASNYQVSLSNREAC